MSHRRISLASLSLIALAACSPPVNNNPDAAQDAATGADSRADASSTPDSTAVEDGSSGSDAAMGADGSDGGAVIPTMPVNLNLSTMGHDRLFGLAFNTDGSFFAVGTLSDSTEATADFRTLLVKFTATGQIDRSWGTNGFVTRNLVVGTNGEVARGIVVQPSGKIVVGATVEAPGAMDARDRNVALARFNADGTQDNSFGTMGVVTLDLSDGAVNGTSYVADGMWSLSQYSDGRIVVSATQRRMGALDSDFAVVRLSVDGQRDMAFGTNGVFSLDIDNRSADIRTSTVLPSGNIVAAGYYADAMSVTHPVLFELTSAGALNPSFGTNGVYNEVVLNAATEAYAAAPQGTSFVTAGYGRNSTMENLDWISLRITGNGTRDRSYGMDGVARFDFMGFNDNARSLVVLPDERVLIIGGSRTSDSNSDATLAMLTRNGALDTSFGTQGKLRFDLGGGSDFFWGVALNPAASHVALVGVKSVGTTGMGNDDAVVMMLPVR
ncbi:MAG: hypothetical protein U0269_08630 [Polyangiales bacterium]